LWRLRGALDGLVGGIGMRRGRRHPTQLQVGDAVDFWRVLDAAEPHRLLLLAEMKLPGKALLEFEIIPVRPQETELRMVSRFLPAGLAGLAYWHMIYLMHRHVFKGMLDGIARSVGQPILKNAEYYRPQSTDTCRLPDQE
jgi:hypothetical protein